MGGPGEEPRLLGTPPRFEAAPREGAPRFRGSAVQGLPPWRCVHLGKVGVDLVWSAELRVDVCPGRRGLCVPATLGRRRGGRVSLQLP